MSQRPLRLLGRRCKLIEPFAGFRHIYRPSQPTDHLGAARLACVGLLDKPPPILPFQPDAFSSRLRSARVTTKIGIPLAICVGICFLTGLWSHYQQHPVAWLPIPTAPIWGYRLSQGLHVATGIAAIPLLLLKLWSVYPRLFEWPAVKSAAHALERLFIAVLVAGMIFQLATGLINISQWYPWKFPFTQTHFAMSFVIVGALFIHLAVKAPKILDALREKRQTRRTPAHVDVGLSRRSFFVAAGASVGAVTITTVGQTVTPLEPVAAFAPRVPTTGPQGLPVNRTAAAAQVTAVSTGNDYRLVIDGPNPTSLTIEELQNLPQMRSTYPSHVSRVGVRMHDGRGFNSPNYSIWPVSAQTRRFVSSPSR